MTYQTAQKKIFEGFTARKRGVVAAIMGVGALILYWITLAPDILASDSAEWQATAATLGISHPPGSPAYSIVGWLFTLVPVGSAAERVNFLSAAVGAAGVVAVFYLMVMLLDRTIPAAMSAVTLGVSAYWWSFSSVAQPYTAVILLIVILMILLLIWHRKGSIWTIWLGAFVIGFGICYHLYIVSFLPPAIVGMFLLGPRKKLLNVRNAGIVLLLLLLGLSFYLYIPIRGSTNPTIDNKAKIDSLSSFIDFVSARDIAEGKLQRFDLNTVSDSYTLVVQKSFYPSFAYLVFAPFILLIHPGVREAMKGVRRYALFLLLAGMAQVLFIFMTTSGYSQYYIAILLYFSLISGFSVYVMMMGASVILKGSYEWVPLLLIVTAYSVVLALGIPQVWDFVDHSDDRSMREYTDEVFRNAEPNAVVLAHWESYSGLIYAQTVDGQRPDLDIRAIVEDDWKNIAVEPGASDTSQFLLSQTLPGERMPAEDLMFLRQLSGFYFIGIKGRTFQDRSHGMPYPAAVQLFEVETESLSSRKLMVPGT